MPELCHCLKTNLSGVAPPEMNNQLTQQLTGKVLFGNINQRLPVVDEIFVRISDCRLHQTPVGHSAVSGHRVEVQIVVQVVRTPFDLSGVLLAFIFGQTTGISDFPHDVFVFPIAGRGSVDRPCGVGLQIVDGHITIVQPSYHHVGVLQQQQQQQQQDLDQPPQSV